MKYDYKVAMTQDIKNYIKDNCDIDAIKAEGTTFDDWYEELDEELWTADDVTGNGSGSYTFCRATAQDYVKDNFQLVAEACREFCVEYETLGEKIANEDWEYLDVTIRCYLLGEMLYDVAEGAWNN